MGCAAWSSRDADRYPDFDRLVRSLGRFLGEIAGQTPPDIKSPGLGDALAGLKLGRTFRGLGKRDAHTILRVLPMAIADFVAEAFETDAVQAAIAWRGVAYCSVGPWSAGTTAILLGDSAGNDGGAAGQTVFAVGGPGAVSDALAAAAQAAGAEIRCGADVAAITSRDGVVTGVALASGEEIAASTVVSGIDPKSTLTQLCDPVAIGPTMLWRAGNYRTPGVVSKVNLVLGDLPRFTAAAGDDATLLRGRIVVAPGIDAIERAFDASKYGRVSESPVLEATIPSLVDPSLVDDAPAGSHVMSVVAQYTPYALRDGTWDDAGRRDAVGDAVVATLESPRAGVRRARPRTRGPDPARSRARLRPGGRAPAPRRAGARPVLPVAAVPRPRPLPPADRRAVPRRLGRTSGRRRHGPARPERGARDHRGR